LYESITMDPTKTLPVDYQEDKLVTDVTFRQQLLSRICKVCPTDEWLLKDCVSVFSVQHYSSFLSSPVCLEHDGTELSMEGLCNTAMPSAAWLLCDNLLVLDALFANRLCVIHCPACCSHWPCMCLKRTREA